MNLCWDLSFELPDWFYKELKEFLDKWWDKIFSSSLGRDSLNSEDISYNYNIFYLRAEDIYELYQLTKNNNYFEFWLDLNNIKEKKINELENKTKKILKNIVNFIKNIKNNIHKLENNIKENEWNKIINVNKIKEWLKKSWIYELNNKINEENFSIDSIEIEKYINITNELLKNYKWISFIENYLNNVKNNLLNLKQNTKKLDEVIKEKEKIEKIEMNEWNIKQLIEENMSNYDKYKNIVFIWYKKWKKEDPNNKIIFSLQNIYDIMIFILSWFNDDI